MPRRKVFALRVGDPVARMHGQRSARSFRFALPIPEADRDALRRLALWATRYTPTVSIWGEESGADGFYLDITGAAHLAGGEEDLLADLHARSEDVSIFPRGSPLRIRPAWPGLCPISIDPRPFPCFQGGRRRPLQLSPSSHCGLRRTRDATLRRLGFKRVGALLDKERAPFRGSLSGRTSAAPRSGAWPRAGAVAADHARSCLSCPAPAA